MSDQEIIQGLLGRDNVITEEFLYVKCKPLLTAIMRNIFSYPVEYNEMVSELYDYLMENDGQKLRQFQYRSSIYQWVKVVAIRFFINRRDVLIEDNSKDVFHITSRGTVVTGKIESGSVKVGDSVWLRSMIFKEEKPKALYQYEQTPLSNHSINLTRLIHLKHQAKVNYINTFIGIQKRLQNIEILP